MAGYKIVTNRPAKDAVQIARQAAKELGFSVARIDECAFSAGKGNLPLSIFLGAFIAYCDFEVRARETGDGRTDVIIGRNRP